MSDDERNVPHLNNSEGSRTSITIRQEEQSMDDWHEQSFSSPCTPLPTEEEMAQPFKLDPLFEFDAPQYYDFEDTDAHTNTVYAVTTFNFLTGEFHVSYTKLDDSIWFETVHRSFFSSSFSPLTLSLYLYLSISISLSLSLSLCINVSFSLRVLENMKVQN
jgi:hypothetical protein